MIKTTVDSQCQAFRLAMDVLSLPWAALVLNVLQAGPLRFNELSAAAHGPGDKVLSQRLKDLEERALLVRRVEPGPPLRVAYELTERGRSFNEVACAIERWGRGLVSRKPKASATAKRARRT